MRTELEWLLWILVTIAIVFLVVEFRDRSDPAGIPANRHRATEVFRLISIDEAITLTSKAGSPCLYLCNALMTECVHVCNEVKP